MSKPKNITPKNCEQATGWRYEQIIRLTGYFGICKNFNYRDVDFFSCDLKSQTIKIEISNLQIKEFSLRINLKEKTIEIYSFESAYSNERIFLKLFRSIIIEAKKRKFNNIIALANRQRSILDRYGKEKITGFIVLALYGFKMRSPDQQKFITKMLQFGRTEKYLHELLATKDGVELWEDIGERWSAIFPISDDGSLIRLNFAISKYTKLTKLRLGLH